MRPFFILPHCNTKRDLAPQMNFKQASEKLKTTDGVFQIELSELFGLYVEYRSGQSGATSTG
jgi:hypothetical protein